MWFRNLQIYRLGEDWNWTVERLADKLDKAAFQPCGGFDMQSCGWVPPRGNEGELLVSVNRQWLIALGVEHKLLPGSVIRQYTQSRLAELEAKQGFKPGRAQARDMRAWIDPVNRWLVVDAASPSKAEEVLDHLKLTLDDLPLRLLRTQTSPATAMTTWVAGQEAPSQFSIDRDCELRAPGLDKAVVRYVRHALEGKDIAAHVDDGKIATRLGMTWRDRISFVLTEQLQVKRVAFLDVLKQEAEQRTEGGDDQLEANFALMSGELAALLADLTEALGDEAE